ncbi:MAG: 6-phosphogluconolactonase [Chlamydiales bacterium]|nr:6-phosphogluconolactonase [Chlamydiales bacterium]
MTTTVSVIKRFDKRRDIVIPGNKDETLHFCVEHFIKTANDAIKDHGYFAVALSGGSTPKAIFEKLASDQNAKRIAWEKVRIFWSDERAVPPDNLDSNYKMAMDAFLTKLPIKKDQVFRMKAERDIEIHAILYEDSINRKVKIFDLIMLGMGDDGHTASLFPHTQGLDIEDRLIVANFIPQKNVWRMSFTYTGIHNTRNLAIYVIGANKAKVLAKVLSSHYEPEEFPAQKIGTPACKALWIVDKDASSLLQKI